MGTIIRPATKDDAAAIAGIYNHYIAESIATFETDPVSRDQMAQRVADTTADSLPWLVSEQDGDIVGYAYAAPWSGRSAYKFSVESTIYVSESHTGSGLGSPLFTALIDRLRDLKLHTTMGGIALPNDASVRLHEKLGFRKVAHFEAVGFKFDRWIDVGYWQLLL